MEGREGKSGGERSVVTRESKSGVEAWLLTQTARGSGNEKGGGRGSGGMEEVGRDV